MSQKTISNTRLERIMQIMEDTKKATTYNKDQGKWFWSDRDEVNNADAQHGPFDTFLEAALDAVEPYLHPEQ